MRAGSQRPGAAALFVDMQPITSELKNARERLLKETFHQQWDFRSLAEHMEQLCGLFPRTSREQHRALIAELHN